MSLAISNRKIWSIVMKAKEAKAALKKDLKADAGWASIRMIVLPWTL